MINPLSINPKTETEKIVNFLKSIHKKTGIDKVVIGLSGGIDSTTVHYLLKKAYKLENIIGVSLPYASIKPIINKFEKKIWKAKIPFLRQSPGAPLGVRRSKKTVSSFKVRLGNIMARTRMIILFDLAKKHNALVCGTENKSEKLLGYFTRFGDAASDIEPISHLYKTQVRQLADYLKVPEKIIQQSPTAGLWNGQTDEGEFGFTYKEADQVLHQFLKSYRHSRVGGNPELLDPRFHGDDRKNAKILIKKLKKTFPNAEKIIKRFKNNQFKLKTPYHL